MASEGSKKAYTAGQIEHMAQAIASQKSTLQQLKAGTRSSRLIDKCHAGLLAGDTFEVELKGRGQPTEGPWELAADLEKRWVDALGEMQNAEEYVRRWRLLWGWGWFSGFALILLAIAALYIILHLRWRPPDPEIFLWTAGRKAYAEVAFWTAFGLLTWTLYNLQHYVRLGYDISVWSQWYISKALQGVPIAIVIVVVIKQIDLGPKVADRIVPIIMGFILGYYSDRARDYLDRIRDKVLSDPAPPSIEITAPADNSTSSLPAVALRGRVTQGEVTQARITLNDNTPKPLGVDGHGNFADLVHLAPGLNMVKLDVETAAKRTGSACLVVHYPGPKPVVTIDAPKGTATVATDKVTVSGTIKDGQGIAFVGRDALLLRDGDAPVPLKVSEKGEFTHEVTLAPGDNLIRVAVPHQDGIESMTVRVTFQEPAAAAPAQPPQP